MNTCKCVTRTSEGPIPHMVHPSGLRMPVVLEISNVAKLQPPKRINGELVYALPGGLMYQMREVINNA